MEEVAMCLKRILRKPKLKITLMAVKTCSKAISVHCSGHWKGLKDTFNFEQSLIERVACRDEVDREILRLLFEAGSIGLLPKDLANMLEGFKVTRYQVSRRILRMNKRLSNEFGEEAAEQRGWHWALTSFVIESWGNAEKKIRMQ
jgi:hypothetical protein